MFVSVWTPTKPKRWRDTVGKNADSPPRVMSSGGPTASNVVGETRCRHTWMPCRPAAVKKIESPAQAVAIEMMTSSRCRACRSTPVSTGTPPSTGKTQQSRSAEGCRWPTTSRWRESADHVANAISTRPVASTRSLPSLDTRRTASCESTARYTNHLPSGEYRPFRAARFNTRGCPPSAGTSYMCRVESAAALKITRVSSAENVGSAHSRMFVVSCTAEPPTCCSRTCGVAPSCPASDT